MYLLPKPPAPAKHSPPPARLLQLGEGAASVATFVGAMRAFKRSPVELARVRGEALDLVATAPAFDELAEVRRVFQYVRDHVRYVRDVNGVDTLQTPTATLERMQGDCDDKSLLLAALLESIGYATRFVVSATNPSRGANHVYLEAWVPRVSKWIPLEPSVRRFLFGKALPSFQPVQRFA